MLTLMKRVFEPNVSYQDKIMYMSSLGLNLSIGSGQNAKNATCVETVLNLVTESNTRYLGLQLLELSLQQNPEFYNKGKWLVLIYNVIKDDTAANLEKVQACKILSMIIPLMANDPSSDAAKEDLIKDIFPGLLVKVNENVEWSEEACICIKMCLKTFPNHLAFSQADLLKTILNQASHNISSKSFEVLAECFCELPYCSRESGCENFQSHWKELYYRTLKTIESLEMFCLEPMRNKDDYFLLEIDLSEFIFIEDSDESSFFPKYVKNVCRLVNLCKCLAKLLSTKTKYSVQVPVQQTLKVLIPLYSNCRKDKLGSPNQEVLYTFIAQMQLAGLIVLESLILNCNLLKNAVLLKEVMKYSIKSSKSVVSGEIVSDLRIATWKVLGLWLDGYGRSVSKVFSDEDEFIEELLKDIAIESSESCQASGSMQMQNKTKKTPSGKSILKKKNQQKLCEAALSTLESLLCIGTLDFSKDFFQEICCVIFKICHAIHYTCDPFPVPYNDESCREKLYSTVMTLMEVSKPDEFKILHSGMKILSHISKDPSFKIKRLSNKASTRYRLLFYPKRPLPVFPESRPRRPNVSNDIRYSEWSSEEFVQNIKIEPTSESPETVNIKIEPSFESENEVPSEEYMEMETHYSERVIKTECNGEDLLDIQSSSQCQDDIESDDEEEEEDEERSYGDEELNQEEPMQEVYIPTTRKGLTSPPVVQIKPETAQGISEPEYEELIPCHKGEENNINSSNKDKCVNGEDNVLQDEEMPSSSTQIANENGIFGIDEDDADEENEEEEEEEMEPCPSEEKIESYDPPPKKQKIETKDDSVVDERTENARSPTLEEMKADFHLPLDDVKSGKAQSTS